MNKKSLVIVALILIAAVFAMNFSAEATNRTGADGSKRMKVTIRATCTRNNSVGNEWSETFTLNGQTISSGSTVEIAPGDKITFGATVTESDPSKDDVGTGRKSITVSEKDISNGFSFNVDVTVTENGGRYKGNKAVWTITVSVK